MTLGQTLDALIRAGAELLAPLKTDVNEGKVVVKAYYPESVLAELVAIPAGNGVMYVEKIEHHPQRFVLGLERTVENQTKRNMVEVSIEEYRKAELGQYYGGKK